MSSLAHLGTCSSAPRRRGRCSRPWGDNAGRAKPCHNNSQERIPSVFVVFVALGGRQFRVMTWLCLVLERLRAIPYLSHGTLGVTAHPMGQLPAVWGPPWVGDVHPQWGSLGSSWPSQAPANRVCQVQFLGEAADAWKMFSWESPWCFVSPQTLRSNPRHVTWGLGTVETAARSHHLFPHARNFPQPSDALADK